LTTEGWFPYKEDLPGEIIGDCVGGKETIKGPTAKICLTKRDYSGKKVSSLLTDPCKDNGGNLINNCNPETVFPANTYSYTAALSYAEESFRAWTSSEWNGYGDGLNPKQTTLNGWLTASRNGNIVYWNGKDCNFGFKVQSYNSSTKSGVLSFADYSKYNCSNAYNANVNFSETAKFSIKERNSVQVLVYQVPMLYKKLNPSDESANWKIFVEKDNKIWQGDYYPANSIREFGVDGSSKLGNKNLLNTYLTMIGAPAFPYPQ
jgi:hypothetical protein